MFLRPPRGSDSASQLRSNATSSAGWGVRCSTRVLTLTGPFGASIENSAVAKVASAAPSGVCGPSRMGPADVNGSNAADLLEPPDRRARRTGRAGVCSVGRVGTRAGH
jgi:hypothetical protein